MCVGRHIKTLLTNALLDINLSTAHMDVVACVSVCAA